MFAAHAVRALSILLLILNINPPEVTFRHVGKNVKWVNFLLDDGKVNFLGAFIHVLDLEVPEGVTLPVDQLIFGLKFVLN